MSEAQPPPDYQLPRRNAHKVIDVAAALSMSKWSVYELIREGRLRVLDLPGHKRITDESVREVLAALKTPESA